MAAYAACGATRNSWDTMTLFDFSNRPCRRRKQRTHLTELADGGINEAALAAGEPSEQ